MSAPLDKTGLEDLINRLLGSDLASDSGSLTTVDRLRLFAHDRATFEFDTDAASDLVDLLEEAAAALRASITSGGVTEEQVEALKEARDFIHEEWERSPDRHHPNDRDAIEDRNALRPKLIAKIDAALEASRVAPVSQKEAGSALSALDRIMSDDRLKRARSKLSFDEIKRMIDHTKAAIREGGSNA